jgi:hypothetical protein
MAEETIIWLGAVKRNNDNLLAELITLKLVIYLHSHSIVESQFLDKLSSAQPKVTCPNELAPTKNPDFT